MSNQATTKEDPARLELRAAPSPVTRLNRRVLVICGAGVAATISGVALWSLQAQPASKLEARSEELQKVQQVPPAEGIEALPRDYSDISKRSDRVPRLGPPLGELGRPILRAEEAAGLQYVDSGDNFLPDPDDHSARAGRLRQAQEDGAAAKAQVFFQLHRKQVSSASAPSETASATDAAMDRVLKLLPKETAPPRTSDQSSDANQNGQRGKESFLAREPDSKIYGSGSLQTSRSPFQLMAGTVIPAALITAINSDLPGQMIASVTQNVYDTMSGQFVLVPQGSRLLGQYDSQVAHGQRRVLLVWTRLILPDGSSIVLDRLPGVDPSGNAGLEDKVNWHWGRVFGGAALSTLIGVGAEVASPARQGNGNVVVAAGRDSLQSTVTDVGQQITKRSLDVQPTITVRAGFPVNVIVNKDLVLRPFQQTSSNRKTP